MNYTELFFRVIWTALIVYQLIAKDSFLRCMVSESGRGISSKRCIAISGMATFLYLCYYVTTHFEIIDGKPVQSHLDGNIVIALVAIILTSATIATLPQLLQLFGIMKGIMPPPQSAPPATENNVQVNVNTE